MNDRERYLETMLFGRPDRVPYSPGGPRESTLKRWRSEGLPEGANWDAEIRRIIGIDPAAPGGPSPWIKHTMIPEFEEKVIEEREESLVVQDWKGNICEISRQFDVTYLRSARDFVTRSWIKCPVENRADWEQMKLRYDPDDPSRIPANLSELGELAKTRTWVNRIMVHGPFWQLREWLGFENLCMMFLDDPELVRDMIGFWTDYISKLLTKLLPHVEIDCFHISEDMAYKQKAMISPEMTREYLGPCYAQWRDIIRQYRVPVFDVDSDGFVGELIPIWIEFGINACDPMEVAAGNDICELRERFGRKMAFVGGVDKRAIAKGGDVIRQELARIEPVVKDGGFIPSCDHGIPHDVGWQEMIQYCELLARITGWKVRGASQPSNLPTFQPYNGGNVLFDRLPIALDITNLEPNVTKEMVANRAKIAEAAASELRNGTCQGCKFTGWLEPGTILSGPELDRLKATVKRLRDETDVLLAIGIGGSYLGARAVIEALADDPDKVVYAGQNISAHYMTRLREQFAGKRVGINVISKSGTTTEPALAFRVMKDIVGSDAKSRIVATTDANKGALLQLAQKEGYDRFVVPDNIGGRFSVLSAVGLLPIAYAGVDIDAFIAGAKDSAEVCKRTDPLQNPAMFYAIARGILYNQGITIELLANFEPRLHYVAEWWKQLYGESEGKENMALFPASVDFTTDLHSMGQYIQQGRRILAETFLIVDGGEPSLTVPRWDDDSDELNYLAGKEVSYVNQKAYEATAAAHRDGGVPNMTILMQKLDAYSLGALLYFFEIACGVSGLMLGVNPFDQPGVEAYKKVMFRLLNKPGYEQESTEEKEPDFIAF